MRSIFRGSLKKGTLEYFASDDSTVLTKQTIRNWEIALKVKLDISKIDQEAIPEAIKKTIVKRLPDGRIDPSVFSVRQLFMNFQTTLNMQSETKFPEDVAKKGDPRFLANPAMAATFETLLTKHIARMKNEGGHVLGYAITVENPNKLEVRQPTFPPTSVTFAVNPFQPQGVPAVAGLDTFNYLMMTDRRPWPTENPASPQWFGNWVTTRDEYGVIAISRRLFIDSYLKRELERAITLKTALELKERSHDGLHWSFELRHSTTRGNGQLQVGSGPTVLSYSDSSQAYLEINGPDVDLKYQVKHDAQVEIPAGGKEVKIHGTTMILAEVLEWIGIRKAAFYTQSSRKGWLEWRLTITLSSVTRGGLSVTISPTADEFKNFANDIKFEQSGDAAYEAVKWLVELFGQQMDNFKSVISTQLQDIYRDVGNMARNVAARLNSMNMFVFPGGREFIMKDPQFNNELDLLVKTEYEFY